MNNVNLNTNIKSYLAGLLEGDGSFISPKNVRDSKKRFLYAKIKVAFNIIDKPLFEKLQKKFGGIFEIHKHFGVWIINKNNELIFVCKTINGFLRTPKINDFYRLIDYLNEKNKDMSLQKLALDKSPLNSNAWLSGFFDADGNFNIIITNRKQSKKNKKRIQIQCRLEIKRNYNNKKVDESLPLDYHHFYFICEKISELWEAGVYTRTRNNQFHCIIVTSYNINSNLKVIEYFEQFPLFSSKYLNYKDWKTIYDLQIKKLHLTPNGLEICERIKRDFNTNRKLYLCAHLNNFYI